MKKITFGLLILMTMIFVSSCKKNNPTDFWSFEGNTYYLDSCFTSTYGGDIVLEITSTSAINTDIGYGILNFEFPGNTLPTVNATYTVVTGNPTGMQVFVSFNRYSDNKGNFTYYATGGGGNETVNVTVSPTGLVSLSGSGIVLQNNASPFDSSGLNFNLTQKQ